MQEVKSGMKRKIIIALVIVVAVVSIILIARSCGKDINMVYVYEKISRGEVTKTISATGNLEVLGAHTIISNIDGMGQKVLVDFNQEVRKGQLLMTIDSPEVDQNYLKAAAQFERSKFEITSAKNELDGKKNLYRENLISKKELELSELKYRKVVSQQKQASIDFDIARKLTSHANIVSPINGIVINCNIESNKPVTKGTTLFIIAPGLDRMRLIINIDETDIGRIKNRQNVSFTVSAYPNKVFEGEIDQVRFNPIKKGDVITYQSLVICDNVGLLLKPGMTATATINVETKENVLRVPNQSFHVSPVDMKDLKGKSVLWLKHGTPLSKLPVKMIEVKKGIVGDSFTEIITTQLREGDEILTGIHKELEVKDELSSYGK